MSTTTANGTTILRTRLSPRGHVTAEAVTPAGKRVTVHVPHHLSTPELIADVVAEAAPRVRDRITRR